MAKSPERRGHPRAAPRRLLARVRDVMAGAGAAQERLDRITEIIAADMVAEVCSVYVRRPGEVLELFATQGLNPDAVHRTRLKFGEGLIGEIAAQARPLALADAQEHPNFAYRPETGEEIYHSLMGVPVLPAAASPVSSRCRTGPGANTPRKRSRRCRRWPWCWPSWSPVASC